MRIKVGGKLRRTLSLKVGKGGWMARSIRASSKYNAVLGKKH